MNKDIIVSQITELEGLIENAPTTTAFKLEMKSRLDKIKENLLTESLKEDIKELFPNDELVNHPVHYESFNPTIKIECIDAMRAAFGDDVVADFCKCNAFKYIWRATSKGKNTDINKAQWYLAKYLELGGCE